MPFAFHCKLCDRYEAGLKPLYRFAVKVEKHFIQRHPEIKLLKKLTRLDYNPDFKSHQPYITDHEHFNDFQPKMRKYSEEIYSIVTISDRLYDHLVLLNNLKKLDQKTLKLYLRQWFDD